MITVPKCLACPALHRVYKEHEAYFTADDDRVIVLFMMYELAIQERSFWEPYFSILPFPESVIHWRDEDLDKLQNPRLAGEVYRRRFRLKAAHRQMMQKLIPIKRDGETRVLVDFDTSEFTYELYEFAWMTIQARAFGRRLPWTAIVPFADCLNHSNVQVRYDYDKVPNTFRMYPNGANSYAQGCEVFNSYGRRTNRFLMIEYGFAILHNEWETTEIAVSFSSKHPFYRKLCAVAAKANLPSYKLFRIHARRIDPGMVPYFRLLSAEEGQLDSWIADPCLLPSSFSAPFLSPEREAQGRPRYARSPPAVARRTGNYSSA